MGMMVPVVYEKRMDRYLDLNDYVQCQPWAYSLEIFYIRYILYNESNQSDTGEDSQEMVRPYRSASDVQQLKDTLFANMERLKNLD